MKEFLLYYLVRSFAFIVSSLPLSVSLWIGKVIGIMAYYFNSKHKAQAYANLKIAFAKTKSLNEIKKIIKQLFINYGQNLIELLCLPKMSQEKFSRYVAVEGKEHICEGRKKGNGVILLAMHFGSWEVASRMVANMEFPYKYFVKPQGKYSRLNDLLNSYRQSAGSIVLSRGEGTRDFVQGLKDNEVIGIVVDQGGKDGVLVPFFDRLASMSVGALRMGLKRDIPICFVIIIRQETGGHRLIIHSPFNLEKTGNLETDLTVNLKKVVNLMEDYIKKYPQEYMWFYKIWKYSNEASVLILHDGKIGHLRQSETVAKMTQKLLTERGIASTQEIIEVHFKSDFLQKLFALLSVILHPLIFVGRLEMLQWVLTEQSFRKLMSVKADFIVSCGSSTAAVNYALSKDNTAKSIVVQKPGLLNFQKFDLVILPQHDIPKKDILSQRVAVTKGAPNLIDEEYLQEQSRKLQNRFSHLKGRTKFKIGLFVGGDSKNVYLSDQQMKVLIHQLREVGGTLNADLLITTSRRTPSRIEQMLHHEFRKDPLCPLLILANRDNVPEAVGGILGLSDIVVVSGDSISMVSEAASSGKYTVVFSPQKRDVFLHATNKHEEFIEQLNAQGFILSSHVKDIGQSIYEIAKNKIQTKKIDDNKIISEALRYII